MPDIAQASPTELHSGEPICSFCDLPPRYCAVLLYNATKTALICDNCASLADVQCRDIKGDQR